MQAKDIDDRAFIEAVREAIRIRGIATRWDVAALLVGDVGAVGEAPVDYPSMPEKVVLAKARSLIRRGLIGGCACGCRGDFSVVEGRGGRCRPDSGH